MARIVEFPWFIGARDETAFAIVTGEAREKGYGNVIEIKERHKYLGTTDDIPNFGEVDFQPLFRKLIIQKALDDGDDTPEKPTFSVGHERLPLYFEFRLMDQDIPTPVVVEKIAATIAELRDRLTRTLETVRTSSSYGSVETATRSFFETIPQSKSTLDTLGFSGSTKSKSGVSADISAPGAEKFVEILTAIRVKAEAVVRQSSDRESVSVIRAGLTAIETIIPSKTAVKVLLTATDRNSNIGKSVNFPGNRNTSDLLLLANELAKQKKRLLGLVGNLKGAGPSQSLALLAEVESENQKQKPLELSPVGAEQLRLAEAAAA